MQKTEEQQKILDLKAEDHHPHIQIKARAGCGKSTIIRMAAEAMPRKQHMFVVFNRANAAEINRSSNRPKNLIGSTFHSACIKELKSSTRGRFELDEPKMGRILRKLDKRFNSYDRTLQGVDKAKVKEDYAEMTRLIKLIKNSRLDFNLDDAINLANDYGVTPVQMDLHEFSEIAIQAVLMSDKIQDKGDWDDVMRYFADRNLAKRFLCDVFCVDEQQDNPEIRNVIIEQMSHLCQVFTVGDDFQAVYAWAGADSNSMQKSFEMIDGVVGMPLTVNFRCDKAIIQKAQSIVPDIRALDSKPDGLVDDDCDWDRFYSEFKPGDVAIARTNRVLITQCFKQLKKGKKATIQGADFAEKLKAMIESLEATNPKDFLDRLHEWYEAICENCDGGEPSEAISEKYECLRWLAMGCSNMEQIDRRINAIFSDITDDNSLKFCSAHRSKGLEWDRVWVLDHSRFKIVNPRIPRIVAEQEPNLLYIAYTRARHELNLVG